MAKNRSASGKPTLIYGLHPVLEALRAGRTLDKIFLHRDESGERTRELREVAQTSGVPVQSVPGEKLERLSRGNNHQGVIAQLAAVPFQPLEGTLLALQEIGEVPLLVMLDGVTDVRNFGAIARSAECLGAHALIIPHQGSAAVNADAVKVSAGALHHLALCREANLVDAVLMMQAYGVQVIGSTEKAGQSLYETDLTGPVCLVLGSEEKGISNTLLKRVDTLTAIPLKGEVNSLNVSVAAGIVLAEAGRQRG